uniref:C1q domain-containing protein n=1 Tax=Gasterosteus aculeatus aculeatus TaxID=481459 RepID=G3PPS3_GASAC
MSRCVSVLLVLVLVARLSSAQQVNNRAELKEVEKVLEELKAERRAMSDRLQAAERELKRVRDTPKVAFAVSLGGNGVVKTTTGSMDLIYKDVLTNVGGAYSDATGEFTAPIRGVYYVRFTANAPTNFPMSAVLYKNGAEVQLIAHEQPSGEGSDTASNGAALLLQAGDKLKMMLWHNTHIWDNSNHHSTFSGFLLFPLVDEPPTEFDAEAELKALQASLKQVQTDNLEVKERLESAERELKATRDVPKVAFAVSLGGNGLQEATTGRKTLIYKDVMTNIGQAYSSETDPPRPDYFSPPHPNSALGTERSPGQLPSSGPHSPSSPETPTPSPHSSPASEHICSHLLTRSPLPPPTLQSM